MPDYLKFIREKIGNAPIIGATTATIIYKDQKILLQKRSDNGLWALHGGFINLGETIEEGMKRELKEEIGIVPLEYQPYGVYSGKQMHYVYPNGDEVYYLVTVFFCTKYEGIEQADGDEVSQLEWFSLNDIPDKLHPTDQIILADLKAYLMHHNLLEI